MPSISDDIDRRPPPGWRRIGEAAGLFARFWHGLGPLGPHGPVDGPPLLVLPGFIATDRTTLQLQRALADAGFRVHGWSLGFNRGAQADTIDRLIRRLDTISTDAPVIVVGWSLGGVFARELARAAPDRVRAAVSLGSPFSDDPRLNNIWRLYEWVAGHPVDQPPIPRIPDKPPVPTLAIWSRKDGIIAPAAARGLPNERDAALELDSSHMGFGVSARVTREVADAVRRFVADPADPLFR